MALPRGCVDQQSNRARLPHARGPRERRQYEADELGPLYGDSTHATSIRFDANNNLYGFDWGGGQGVGSMLFEIDTSDASGKDIDWIHGDQTRATSMAIRH